MKAWLDRLPPMFRTPSTSSGQVQDSIRDELMFHFRQLVSEKVAQGASFDDAWELAERQFGPIRQIEIQCQTVQWQSRLAWSIVAVTAVCLVLAGGLRTLVSSPQSTLEEKQALKTSAVLAPDEDRSEVAITPKLKQLADLTGRVLDGAEGPITQAKILVILKTWPSGRYRQDDFLAETDNDGKFVLPELVPIADQYAIQVTVVKEGYALESHYKLKTRPDELLLPVEFRLEPTTTKTLVFQDEAGKPIRQINVIPSTRISSQGDEFHVYFQGAKSIQVTSDAEGRVDLANFSTGDRAELYYQLPGESWKTQKVDISGEEIVVQLPGTSTPL